MNTLLTLLSETQLRSFVAAGHWQNRTIYDEVAEQAARRPGKVAIRERHRLFTFAELVDTADRLAAALIDEGLHKGDRVAVWLPSRAEVAVATLACSLAGFVVCPSMHRDHTAAEIAELIRRMRASAVIFQNGYGADTEGSELAASVNDLPHLKFLRALDAPSPGGVFADLPAARSTAPASEPNTVVYLAFTSGTTGQPKGVMHSDNTLLAPVRAMARDWSLAADAVIYSLSPLSHNLGFGAMLLALTTGAEFVVHDLARGRSLADRLRETKATFAFGVPTHAIDLLSELQATPRSALPQLRGFRISGAAAPPAVVAGLLAVGITPQSGFGMTEGGSHHYTLPDTDAELITLSSGTAHAGYEVAIVSQEDPDKVLPPGEVGQIAGRGPSLMLGYFDDQAATEASFNSDGWFLTGDVGWVDEGGYLRITGRKKDLIIRGGHNIYPAKIENLAVRHEAVANAAAVPVSDQRLGERVCLAIEMQAGESVTTEELLEHLRESGLSKYDMPEYFLIVDQLPRMPSGKIFKRRLTEWLKEGRLTAQPVRPGL